MGYVLKGKYGMRVADGVEEVFEAGDAFFIGPGHTPIIFAGCEVVYFTRTEEANRELAVVMPPGLPLLWCDEKKLKKILLNLLDNAAKFTPAGGRIEIEAAATDRHFTVAVRDTGIGIDKNDLARVILPFAQADSTAARRHQGAGLGLTLAKLMMEVHGGSLRLESEVGRGTVAWLLFPNERVIAVEGRTPDRRRVAAR